MTEEIGDLEKVILLYMAAKGPGIPTHKDELKDVHEWYVSAKEGRIANGPAQIELVLGGYMTLHIEGGLFVLKITDKGRATVANKTE